MCMHLSEQFHEKAFQGQSRSDHRKASVCLGAVDAVWLSITPDLMNYLSIHTMTFQFITNEIGPKERRLIRSHVMHGKNAGRPCGSRRKIRDAITQQSSAQHADTHGIFRPRLELRDIYRSDLFDRLICNDLAYAEIPQQSTQSIELSRQCKTILCGCHPSY